MTAHLAGATRDRNGVRLCPLGCGPSQGSHGDNNCRKATRKQLRPGEWLITPALPGVCRMFYDEKGNPT